MTVSFRERCAIALSSNHNEVPPGAWEPAWRVAIMRDTDAVLAVVNAELDKLPCYPSCSDHEPCLLCDLREYLET
jgi:hypothetical protein